MRRQSGKIRIIGGDWRGRLLKVPEVPDLRPTPDRVRETLFNWCQGWIAGATCLDLFAGSGALGLEAASRGAARVDLVEKNRQACRQLAENVDILKTDTIRIAESDVLQWLQRCETQYDLIFLDPPYRADLWRACCETILERKLLKPDGRLYLESDHADLQAYLPAGLILLKSARAGQVYYGLAMPESAQAGETE